MRKVPRAIQPAGERVRSRSALGTLRSRPDRPRSSVTAKPRSRRTAAQVAAWQISSIRVRPPGTGTRDLHGCLPVPLGAGKMMDRRCETPSVESVVARRQRAQVRGDRRRAIRHTCLRMLSISPSGPLPLRSCAHHGSTASTYPAVILHAAAGNLRPHPVSAHVRRHTPPDGPAIPRATAHLRDHDAPDHCVGGKRRCNAQPLRSRCPDLYPACRTDADRQPAAADILTRARRVTCPARRATVVLRSWRCPGLDRTRVTAVIDTPSAAHISASVPIERYSRHRRTTGPMWSPSIHGSQSTYAENLSDGHLAPEGAGPYMFSCLGRKPWLWR